MKEKRIPQDYTGDTMHIILEVPVDVYHLEISAKTVDENEETQVYTGRMCLADIKQARQDFLENVPGGDAFDCRPAVITGKQE